MKQSDILVGTNSLLYDEILLKNAKIKTMKTKLKNLTAKETLEKHCGLALSMLPGEDEFKNRILKAMKQYALDACEKQRKICAKEFNKYLQGEGRKNGISCTPGPELK